MPEAGSAVSRGQRRSDSSEQNVELRANDGDCSDTDYGNQSGQQAIFDHRHAVFVFVSDCGGKGEKGKGRPAQALPRGE